MNKPLLKEVFFIAIPVALQCMLQSSFSIIDQLMIGQLGTISIAAVGLAGKFVSLFTVVSGAVATVTGIMIAQNIGSQDEQEAVRSFSVNHSCRSHFYHSSITVSPQNNENLQQRFTDSGRVGKIPFHNCSFIYTACHKHLFSHNVQMYGRRQKAAICKHFHGSNKHRFKLSFNIRKIKISTTADKRCRFGLKHFHPCQHDNYNLHAA